MLREFSNFILIKVFLTFFYRLPVWNVFCKDGLSSAVQYASGDACALASEDENVHEKVCWIHHVNYSL